MEHPPSLVIAGVTGGGKTALALRIAQELSGEILNIDSVQLYRDHRIGAAMPTEEDFSLVPHHLYGVLEGDVHCDLHHYIEMAQQKIREVQARGKYGIFVGGSSLYIQSLLEGVSDLPAGDSDLRSALEEESSETLYARLRSCDPVRAAELHINDRLRVIRALEVTILAGKPFSELCMIRRERPLQGQVIVIVPVWNREKLYRRINGRARRMVQGGIIEETECLRAQYGERWQASHALGYAQTLSVLSSGDEIDRDGLIEEISKHTRRYAKRQMTYWRNAPERFGWTVEHRSSDTVELGTDSAGKGRAGEERKGVVADRFRFEPFIERLQEELSLKRDGAPQVWYLDAEHLHFF